MATSLELYAQHQHLVSQAVSEHHDHNEDMWQDAYLGLWVAATEYDPCLGYNFVDVANVNISFHILLGIQDRLNDDKDIVGDWVVNPEDEAIESVNLDIFIRVIAELDTISRLCVELPYSLSRIAKQYGLPKTMLCRYRREVLQYLLSKLC